MDRSNELIREQAQSRPAVQAFDLAAWVAARPEGEFDPKLRKDGIHLTHEGAVEIIRTLMAEVPAGAHADGDRGSADG